SGQSPAISVATTEHVTFPNVAVWDMRPVQTLAIGHLPDAGPAMPVEARLGVRGGRVGGQGGNPTRRAVRNLQLVSPSGAQAQLAPAVPPGASLAVDAALGQGAPGLPIGKGVIVGPLVGAAGGTALGPVPPRNGGQAMVALAAGEVAVRP